MIEHDDDFLNELPGTSAGDDSSEVHGGQEVFQAIPNEEEKSETKKSSQFQGAPPESSLIPVQRQPSPTQDVPVAPKTARGRGRGNSQANSKTARVPTGDLRDIENKTRVGDVMYDNTAYEDTIERRMRSRRAPLSRETSFLITEGEDEEHSASLSDANSAWPSMNEQNGGTVNGRDFLLIIQQGAKAFSMQMVQCNRRGLSKLCYEIDALLHDFLIHVCNLGDMGAFMNYHELQTGIHEVIGDMANNLTGEVASVPRSSKFARPSECENVGKRIQMPLLEFLRKVPDRFLLCKVRPLNTVAKRLGNVAGQVLNEQNEKYQPGYIYEYMIHKTAMEDVPHNITAVLIAELCRLISKNGDNDPDLRFRVTIGTVIFYSVMRIIDISEEQKFTEPGVRNLPHRDYLSAVVETGIVKALCSLCNGKMRELCTEAISELFKAVSPVISASSSNNVITAKIGRQQSISNEEVDAILERKKAAERGETSGSQIGGTHSNSPGSSASLDESQSAATSSSNSDSKESKGGCSIS